MTKLRPYWVKIYESLTKGDDDYYGQSIRMVDVYHLTSHLSELYDKIDKLESRLNELDPPMNDVSGPTGLIGDPQ
jgi:hypothetical protein